MSLIITIVAWMLFVTLMPYSILMLLFVAAIGMFCNGGDDDDRDDR